LAVTTVPIEQPLFLVLLSGMAGVTFDTRAVGDDQVFPAVVVKVDERGAPSKISGVDRQA